MALKIYVFPILVVKSHIFSYTYKRYVKRGDYHED